MLFFPLDKHLFVGQTTIFAVTGLLSSYRFYTSKKYFKSGSLFALTLFKPHLFIPLYVLLTIKAFREKRTNVMQFLTGTFLVVFVLSGIAIILRPSIFTDFVQSSAVLYQNRLTVRQATIGHTLTRYTGNMFIIPIVTSLGVVSAILLSIPGKQPFCLRAQHALFLGIICAPYAWAHDQLLLLPSYLICANYLLKWSYGWGLFFLALQFAYCSWLFMTDAFLLEWGTILLPPTLWVVLLLFWYQHPINNTKKIPAEIL